MTVLDTRPVQPGSSAAAALVRRIATARETGILIALLLVIVAATVANPSFLFSGDGFRDLLLTPSLLLLVAIGSAIVIITRNVDLSVGSIVGLTAYLTGRMFIDIPGIPLIGVFIGGVLLGGFLGLINGALVAFARVPALVITLGTLYIYRGINVAWAGGDRINASDLPKDFRALGTDRILGIPILTIIAAVVLIAAAWYLRNLRSGRELYAIGSDPAAAHLYGLRVTRRVIGAFVVSRRAGGPGRRAVRRPLRHGELGRRIRLGAAGDRRRGDRRRRDLGRRRNRLGCRDRRLPAAHHQPRPADPRHRRLLAARRGRRAHHRLDRARPRPRGPPASTTHRTTGGGPMTAAHRRPRPRASTSCTLDPRGAAFLLTREAAIIALLILVIAVASVTVRNFDSPLTVTYLLRDVAPILLIALPMTLIIITEEIDLSVASIVGLSSVTTGILTNAGWPFAARRAHRDPRRRARAEWSTASS